MHDADDLEPEPRDTTGTTGSTQTTETTGDADASPGADPLETLVGQWLSVPEAAQLQGVSLSAIRGQLKDRELVAVRRGPNNAVSIPAAFVTADGPRPELRGTVTVLADGGMHDEELVRWLFTPDSTLPADHTPIGCLVAGHKTEIRRRAMETAF